MSFLDRPLLTALLLLPLLAVRPATPRTRAADRPAPGGDTRLALRTAEALYDGVRTETLDNGLRVYLKPLPASPVVTTMMAYKVGSADEELTSTGLSHYLEHLMFKGTARLMPGDIDRLTFRNGGANNAYTSEDYTIFHFDFPYDRWEVALQIEADRMRNLRIDHRHEFEQEKGAVLNELSRNEDTPWDLELKAILPLLFGKKSPYGHPVIGEPEHVKEATAEVIKAHYDKWYHPNNASLVVCGGFDPDEALAKIKKLFGPIPRAKLPPRKPLPEVKLKRPAHFEMESKFPTPRLLMGFTTVRSKDPDYAALSVLEVVLGGGKTGRLYRNLVEGAEIAGSVGASNAAGRYPGWFAIEVELLPGKEIGRAEKLVLEQLEKLREAPINSEELKRAQHSLLAGTVFSQESAHGLADRIAQWVTTNDLDSLKRLLPSILAVTPADVQRVARKYFAPEQRVAVWSVPPKGKGAAAPLPRRATARADRAASREPFSLKKTRRVELPNGLVLLLLEDHRLPIFVADASLRESRLLEPAGEAGVATLTGYMLDEGTTEHTGQQIARMIEDVGGSLSLSSSGGAVRVLSPDRKLGLRLLLECLTSPSFPRDAFARNKDRLLGEVEESEAQPDTRARLAFRAAVYGKHPYGRSNLGTLKTVKALTREDLADFHHRAFVPNNTILAVVGDFDSDAVVEEVKQLTAGWKKAPLKQPRVPAVKKPEEFEQKVLTMPGAAQLHLFMGHVGVRRSNPDYYKLLVLDYVLGTGPGFTDRLSSRLRDREGLAYTVTANISNSAGPEPGVFVAYIGTYNQNFARVKKEILEELNRIRNEKPGKREVEDAKAYLLGSLLLHFTTDAGVAEELVYVERNHLGFDYLEDYRKAVAAVTPEEVQEAARKYINPRRMFLVAAGAVDQSGKPLHKAPPKR